MTIHAQGWSASNAAEDFARTTVGNGPARPGRHAGKTVVHAFVGLAALSACLMLAPVAAAQSAATATAQVRTATPESFSTANRAATLPAWPVLRLGSNSSWPPVTVRSLQYLLNAHGAQLGVDGIFGTRTGAAVRAFQRTHGLVVDGIVGQHTWSAVIVTVRRGSGGAAVKAVQDQANFRNLRGDGPPTLQVDGVFGPRTETWVRGYQSAIAPHVLGFSVDGIVGPMTWQALITETLSG